MSILQSIFISSTVGFIFGFFVIIYLKTECDSPTSIPTPTPTPNNDTYLKENGIVSRLKWSRSLVNEDCSDLKLPVKFIIIQHTVTPNCTTYLECVNICKSILTYHTSKLDWLDIGYNFLIGGDGRIYEGLGFYKEGSHTVKYNKQSLGIAFIGNFEIYPATQKQIDAAEHLFKLAAKMNITTKNYEILAASEVTATLNPGKFLIEQIQKIWYKTP